MADNTDTVVFELCVDYIRKRYHFTSQLDAARNKCIVVGISGPQGCGKSTLAARIARVLNASPNHLYTVAMSIDDFYLTRSEQLALSHSVPDNPLLRNRGVASTHNIGLLSNVLDSLLKGRSLTRIPMYDKGAFAGAGDRCPTGEWSDIVQGEHDMVQVIIIEGWCVGFRALDNAELHTTWQQAVERAQQAGSLDKGQLGKLDIQHVKYVNDALRSYDQLTDRLAGLIHLDAVDPQYVYEWRLQQEADLRRRTGHGMSEAQVMRFVDAYYSSYELYNDGLRAGTLKTHEAQLHLLLNLERQLILPQEQYQWARASAQALLY